MRRGAAGVLRRLPEGTGYYDPVKRARRFARAASLPLEEAYFDLVRVFDRRAAGGDLPGRRRSSAVACSPIWMRASRDIRSRNLVEANMRSYLPDDLLIKADRCSMQASLEARAPFLDHQLAEYAATIPFNLKLKRDRGRSIF